MNYGERLRAARKQKNLSQGELAELSNVGQGTISKIERGDQEKSTYDIDLADVLDIHPKWLKDGDMRYEPLWLHDHMDGDIVRKDIEYQAAQTTPLWINNEQLPASLRAIDINYQKIKAIKYLWSDFCTSDNSVKLNKNKELLEMHIKKEVIVNNNCFWLELDTDKFIGTVMRDGVTKLSRGMTLLIDPELAPKDDDVIIIRFGDENATLARWIAKMGELHIEPFERGYPGTVKLEGKNYTILGVVIWAQPSGFKP